MAVDVRCRGAAARAGAAGQRRGGADLRLRARRVGDGPALAVAVAYLLFGGVQQAVWFDFHEVAFAPLLFALAVERADAGARGAAVATGLALLLVKEDLALVLPFLGVLVGGRAGVALAVAGVAWFVGVTQVLVPDYQHVELGRYLDEPWMKLRTLTYTFGAFLFLSLRSRVVLVAVPLLAVRFLSAKTTFWTLEDHYSLTIAPVLALAATDGLRGLPRRTAYPLPAIAVALIPAFPLVQLLRPGAYRVAPGYEDVAARIRSIPDGAAVTATNRIVPHLSGRRAIYLLGQGEPRGIAVRP